MILYHKDSAESDITVTLPILSIGLGNPSYRQNIYHNPETYLGLGLVTLLYSSPYLSVPWFVPAEFQFVDWMSLNEG